MIFNIVLFVAFFLFSENVFIVVFCVCYFRQFAVVVLFLYVVIVEMRGEYGYLSAIEWPLLPVSCYMISRLFEYFDSSFLLLT